MSVSTESIQKYTEGLKADLAKAKERKEQSEKILQEAETQIKVLDGALQFAALLIQESEKNKKKESEKNESSEVEGAGTPEGEEEQPNP